LSDGKPTAKRGTIQMLKPLVPRHSVRIRHRVGTLEVDVDFTLTARWTVLFGPSGSGKTTILRAIAGLLRPDAARIVGTLGPDTDQETSFTYVDTAAGIFVPAHRRVVRLAAQQPALFPHLTVLENIKYGMNLMVVRDAEEREALARGLRNLLDTYGIAPSANKLPAALSGGEAQRVNLARAVAASGCRLLMLDEPFSGLDLALRDKLIATLLERHASPRTGQVLSVTHDIAEAFQLNAEVIKLHEGRIVQQGPAEVVLADERLRLLAHLRT
jgi:molybdate transport system ATP-binding protein